MIHITRFIGVGLLFALTILPVSVSGEPNTDGGPSTHDCAGVPRNCGAWGAKGANTCRTCKQAQCKTENGKDVRAGNKTQTECYDGHGSPPPELTRPPISTAPQNLPKAPPVARQ